MSLLHASRLDNGIGLLIKITKAGDSPVARWANAGKLSGRKPEKYPGTALRAPQRARFEIRVFLLLDGSA